MGDHILYKCSLTMHAVGLCVQILTYLCQLSYDPVGLYVPKYSPICVSYPTIQWACMCPNTHLFVSAILRSSGLVCVQILTYVCQLSYDLMDWYVSKYSPICVSYPTIQWACMCTNTHLSLSAILRSNGLVCVHISLVPAGLLC